MLRAIRQVKLWPSQLSVCWWPYQSDRDCSSPAYVCTVRTCVVFNKHFVMHFLIRLYSLLYTYVYTYVYAWRSFLCTVPYRNHGYVLFWYSVSMSRVDTYVILTVCLCMQRTLCQMLLSSHLAPTQWHAYHELFSCYYSHTLLTQNSGDCAEISF
jgi:hypothetical protein